MFQDWTILNGATTSAAVRLPQRTRLAALIVPTMDSCTLKIAVAKAKNGTYRNISDSAGADATIGGVAQTWNRAVPLTQDQSHQVGSGIWAKIVAGAAQTADRTITGKLTAE